VAGCNVRLTIFTMTTGQKTPLLIPYSRSDCLQLIGLRSILLGAKRHSAELLTISVCCPLTPF
jgi:hypothetical protein